MSRLRDRTLDPIEAALAELVCLLEKGQQARRARLAKGANGKARRREEVA